VTAYLIVFLGAGFGGMARHAVNVAAMKLGSAFPWHTLVVNVVGSLLMGLLIGWLTFKGNASQEWRLFAATGVLGGFTTFSAFSLDAALLFERHSGTQMALYIVGSVGLSIVMLFAGLAVFRMSAP
jgi:CrcB protein